MDLQVNYTGDVGKMTAAAGTAIKPLIPPKRGSKTRVVSFSYTPGATTHTLTVMRPLTSVYVGPAAAAGQAVVVLRLDPGTQLVPSRPLATNDWVVLEGPLQNNQPTFILAQVSSVTAGTDIPATPTTPAYNDTLNVTLTANLPTGGVLAGAKCWMLGITTDGHPQFTLETGATRTLENNAVGFCGARSLYEPVVLWIDNITNAGVLNNAVIAYTNEQNFGTVPVAAELPGEGEDPGQVQAVPEEDAYPLSIVLVPPDEWRETRREMQQEETWRDPEWENWDDSPLWFFGHPGDPNFGKQEGEEEEEGDESEAAPKKKPDDRAPAPSVQGYTQPPGEEEEDEEGDEEGGQESADAPRQQSLPPTTGTPKAGSSNPGSPMTNPAPTPGSAKAGASNPGGGKQPPIQTPVPRTAAPTQEASGKQAPQSGDKQAPPPPRKKTGK